MELYLNEELVFRTRRSFQTDSEVWPIWQVTLYQKGYVKRGVHPSKSKIGKKNTQRDCHQRPRELAIPHSN